MDRDFNVVNFSFSLRQQHSALLCVLKYTSSITGRKDLDNAWNKSFSTGLYSNFIELFVTEILLLRGTDPIN